MRAITSLLFLASAAAGEPVLTIYNQDFAVIRETVPLDLRPGLNTVRFDGITALAEAESVVLRDPAGRAALRVVEQNYLADPVSAEALLLRHEGQTIDFYVRDRDRVVRGRIVRAAAPPSGQPIVEVDGKLQFQLPGLPLFPPLAAGTLVKPSIEWLLETAAPARFDAELSYVSSGFHWAADYNIVAAASAPALSITGWVTMQNQSGRSFENAQVKLMAGDVAKLAPRSLQMAVGGLVGGVAGGVAAAAPPVAGKSFDEYHLYTLHRPVTLRHRETKQAEFLRSSSVQAQSIYLYDGMRGDPVRFGGWGPGPLLSDPGQGMPSNSKVWVMREFSNTESSGLGMPLPQGRVRFYRRDSDGRLEFTGEDEIRHTPRGGTVRVFSGAAFDLTGERRRVSLRVDHARSTAEESFEIRLSNRKSEAVEVRVVEHLFRWSSWELTANAPGFQKTDSQTMECKVRLQPGEEKTASYTVRHTW